MSPGPTTAGPRRRGPSARRRRRAPDPSGEGALPSLRHRQIVAAHGPGIELARAADLLIGVLDHFLPLGDPADRADRKSTHLNSSHSSTSYAVFCLKKKKN